MATIRHDHMAEMKSVNKLLEIAQMKHYLEEIQTDKPQQFSPYLNSKDHHYKVHNKPVIKHQSVSLQRYHQQKQKHSFENQDNNQRQRFEYRNNAYDEVQDGRVEPNSARLPIVGRQSANSDHFFSLNSTFYAQNQANTSKNQNQFTETYRYIRGNELSAVFANKDTKPKNNVVYFRPNKSETIREVLNQMKIGRTQNNGVALNSMLHDFREEQSTRQSMMFSQNQLKQLKKYKNFMPFREDERLLIQKIGEKQSIWKRKFKQSWQKQKLLQEGRRGNLKSLAKK